MKIRDAVYHQCPECSTYSTINEAVYGCDGCGKVFADNDRRLEFTNFSKDDAIESKIVCSWACFFRMIETFENECDDFIQLPHLDFSTESPGCTFKDFIKAAHDFHSADIIFDMVFGKEK